MNLRSFCNLQIVFLRVQIPHAWSQPKDNLVLENTQTPYLYSSRSPVLYVKKKKMKKSHTQLKYSMCLVFTKAYSPENDHLKYVLQIEFLMGYM